MAFNETAIFFLSTYSNRVIEINSALRNRTRFKLKKLITSKHKIYTELLVLLLICLLIA